MGSLREGDKAKGKYMGVAFVGTVHSVRRHTVNAGLWIVSVDLASPITVYGTKRDDVLMHVSTDGVGQGGQRISRA